MHISFVRFAIRYLVFLLLLKGGRMHQPKICYFGIGLFEIKAHEKHEQEGTSLFFLKVGDKTPM